MSTLYRKYKAISIVDRACFGLKYLLKMIYFYGRIDLLCWVGAPGDFSLGEESPNINLPHRQKE